MDYAKIREKLIKEAVKDIRESVNRDDFIIQAVNNIEEITKLINVLANRLRDWYSFYLPEFSMKISDNEAFLRLITTKSKKEIMKELKITESMGAELSKEDLEPIEVLTKQINSLILTQNELKVYLEKTMNDHCKNFLTLCGTMIGAKLLREAGSLKKMALMPSGTIQLLGAEKALFRHLKTGARPPKHGLIVNHPYISSSPKEHKGHNSRVLADKLVMAARADFFGDNFIADQLVKDLEKKLKK